MGVLRAPCEGALSSAGAAGFRPFAGLPFDRGFRFYSPPFARDFHYDLAGGRLFTREPSGFRPTQIDDDAVLGRQRDELEVEYVELYRLEKPSG